MFGFLKSNPFKLDRYSTRLSRENGLYKPVSIYASKRLSYIVTALFVLTDAVCLYSCWNMVQTSNPAMIYLITIGCAVILDVPLAIAGWKLKAYYQNMESKKSTMLILTMSILAFSITFIFYFIFRIITKDLVFDLSTSSNMSNSMAADMVQIDEASKATVLFAAIFSGIIPLASSIASFVISFVTADPVNEELRKIRKAKITAESNLVDIEVAKAEAENVNSYCDYLLARENDLFNEFMNEGESQKLEIKQMSRIILMEKLRNPEAITSLANSGKELNVKEGVSSAPELESVKFIKNYNQANA